MFVKLRQLLEMIRFSHTLFALPFALLAAMMAWAANARSTPPVQFAWRELLGIVLCMVFARSAAMAFNRLADRRIDAAESAHENAALARGRAELRQRGVFHGGLLRWDSSRARFCFCREIRFRFTPPCRCCCFSFRIVIAKRFTQLAHFWLGAALALAPLAAWVAIRAGDCRRAACALRGGAVLGGRLRYHLRLPGFRVRCPASGCTAFPPAGVSPGALKIAAACHLAMVALLAMLPLLLQ